MLHSKIENKKNAKDETPHFMCFLIIDVQTLSCQKHRDII